MQKQWDNSKLISFRIGLPENEPTLKEIIAVLKLKRISSLMRALIAFVKTEAGQNALQDFISNYKKTND